MASAWNPEFERKRIRKDNDGNLKTIDALDNSRRGVWSIAQKGLDHLEMDGADEALKNAHKAVMRERRKARAEQQPELVEENEDPIEGDEEGEEDWKGTLLEFLKSMEPSAFERLSMRLVKEAGFQVEAGKSGDGSAMSKSWANQGMVGLTASESTRFRS